MPNTVSDVSDELEGDETETTKPQLAPQSWGTPVYISSPIDPVIIIKRMIANAEAAGDTAFADECRAVLADPSKHAEFVDLGP